MSKKEAEKFELRYKKVKFIEKRKVIRHIEHMTKDLEKDPENESLKKQKQDWKNKLAYIDNHPNNWKYISLFAKTGDAEKDAHSEKLRSENMQKILKTVEVKQKIRDQEMMDADKDSEEEMSE